MLARKSSRKRNVELNALTVRSVLLTAALLISGTNRAVFANEKFEF